MNYSQASSKKSWKSGHSTSKFLHESDIQRLQREVDNYTRKLEQEKRRLFGVEETNAMVKREFKDQNKKIKDLKDPRKNNKKKVQILIKTKQKEIDLAISKYNQTMAQNKVLKKQINVLRQERSTNRTIIKNLQKKVEKSKQEYDNYFEKYENDKQKAEDAQEKILLLKERNEEQQVNFVQQFEYLQTQMREERMQKEFASKTLKRAEARVEGLDTQKILKRRLQKIILNNKEKVKVIDQYQRNMKIIDNAFTQIKEQTGITDIEEIMNTFIKSEEQNYSLFNYVDLLTSEIDKYEQKKKQLEDDIARIKLEKQQKLQQCKTTPEEDKLIMKAKSKITNKQAYIEKVNKVLTNINDPIEKTLVAFSKAKLKNPIVKQKYNETFDSLSDRNYEFYLSDLEQYIDYLIKYISVKNNQNNILTNTLLLDNLEPKDFSVQQLKGKPNPDLLLLMKYDENVDISTSNYKRIPINKFEKFALDVLENSKQNNPSQQSGIQSEVGK